MLDQPAMTCASGACCENAGTSGLAWASAVPITVMQYMQAAARTRACDAGRAAGAWPGCAHDSCMPWIERCTAFPMMFTLTRSLRVSTMRASHPGLGLALCALAVAFVLPGCRQLPQHEPLTPSLEVGRFSAAQPGGPLLDGWRPLILSRFKKPTQYRLISKDGATVVAAHASASASGLIHDVDVDVQRYPWLEWRWLVANIIEQADSTRAATDDSPARIVLCF